MPYKRNTPAACIQCGKAFLTRLDIVKHGGGKYCSRACQAAGQRGEGNPCWRGGLSANAEGYLSIFIDGKNVRHSHYVMEQHIGRAVRADEHVHHINGKRDDDRIENLQLMTAAAHYRLHSKGERWARAHDACIECGGTDRPHMARGLCTTCYARQFARHKSASRLGGAETPPATVDLPNS